MKNSFSYVMPLIAIFAPIKPIIITVFLLIIADLIFGIWAAHKRGDAITSAGFRRTVTKIFVYEITILIGFLCQKYLLMDTMPLVNMLAGLIAIVELKSLLENGNEILEQDIFKSLIKHLGSKNDDKNS